MINILILNFFFFFSSLYGSIFSNSSSTGFFLNTVQDKRISIDLLRGTGGPKSLTIKEEKKKNYFNANRPVLRPWSVSDHLKNNFLKGVSFFSPGSTANVFATLRLLQKNFLVGDIHHYYTFSSCNTTGFKLTRLDQQFLDQASFFLYALMAYYNTPFANFFNNKVNYYTYRSTGNVTHVIATANVAKFIYLNILLPLAKVKKAIFYKLNTKIFNEVNESINLNIMASDLHGKVSLFNNFNKEFDFKDYAFHKVISSFFGREFMDKNHDRVFLSLLLSELTAEQLSHIFIGSVVFWGAGRSSAKGIMKVGRYLSNKTPRVIKSMVDKAIYNFDAPRKKVFLYGNLAFLFDNPNSDLNTLKMALLNYFIKREYALLFDENYFLSNNQIDFAKNFDLDVLKIELAYNISKIVAVYLLNPGLLFNSSLVDFWYGVKKILEESTDEGEVSINDSFVKSREEFEDSCDQVRSFLFPALPMSEEGSELFRKDEQQMINILYRAVQLFCLDPDFLRYYVQAANPMISYEESIDHLNKILLLKNKLNL
jgi:hypothetical protein